MVCPPGAAASEGTLIEWPQAGHGPNWPAYSSETSASTEQCGQGNRIGTENSLE